MNKLYAKLCLFCGTYGKLIMIILPKEEMEFLSGTQCNYNSPSLTPFNLGGIQED
jgi:hypothetical protein